MWVMPSSSARCAQLPRAADKVPFYGALKKFRDYLNGLVVDYDESDYVFNDPKYTTISTEAELKEENLAFTALNENGDAIIAAAAVVEANKKKRGRPKKVRGENGEEIPTPSRRKKDKNENLDGIDEDPNKKKRGRPKKPKDGATTPTVAKKRSSKKAPQAPSTDDINSMSSNIQSPSHISSLPPNTNSNNTNGSNSNSFLPPMESPSANNSSSTSNNYQSGALSQNSSPPTDANHCFPQSMNIDHQVAPQPEISPHPTYQRSTSNQQLFSNTSEDMTNEIVNDPIQSPVASSPSLAPSDFEPPQPATNNSADLNPYSQPQQSTVDHHQHHSPLAQTHSPLGMYQSQSQQAQMAHHQMMHSPSYSPFSRQQQQQQQQQNFMQSSLHQQQPNQTQNVHSTKQQQQQMGGQMNGVTTDLFKDVAAKSLSGLESLVDQIPNINEQDSALGALAQSTGHSQNGKSSKYFLFYDFNYFFACV